MCLLHTNLTIRMRPPSILTKNKWLIEDFDSRKTFSIAEPIVSLLIFCLTPQKKETVIKELSENFSLTPDKTQKTIDSLIKKNLLALNDDLQITSIDNDKRNSDLFYDKYLQWNTYNWGSAADYHFFTYDYPFLDYSDGASGWQIASKRMDEYSEKESDTNRVKKYPDSYVRIFFSSSNEELIDDVQEILHEKDFDNNKLDKLAIIAAFAFLQTTEATIPWKGIPLIRRTSPSGGSRHPTEGYVIVLESKKFDKGLYHIQSMPFSFVELAGNEPINTEAIFPELYSDPKQELVAIVVLTSIFARNMFRYREPRTFRTIHMDTGHILGTIELISAHLHVPTKISNQFDEEKVEQLIGIDGLSEGVITSIGIFKSLM